MQHSRRHFTRTALLATAGCTTLARQLLAEPAATQYTVQPGDTLGHIALRHNTSAASLKQANQLSSDLIRSGQTLKIPGQPSPTDAAAAPLSSATHTVQRGDTLGSIALTHGVTLSALKQANQLSGDLIRIGQTLHIPASNMRSADLLADVRAATDKITVRRDNWQRIVVHHSAIKYGNAKKYDAAHRQRGMQNGLAYHCRIGNGIDSGDGEIEVGPR